MELSDHVTEKIAFGEELIYSLTSYGEIEGIQKLHRKIKQELSFLKKVSQHSFI